MRPISFFLTHNLRRGKGKQFFAEHDSRQNTPFDLHIIVRKTKTRRAFHIMHEQCVCSRFMIVIIFSITYVMFSIEQFISSDSGTS